MNTDTPVTSPSNPSHLLELAAIKAYRTKYPDGIPWQDFHIDTRVMWLEHEEKK